jgi:hypothetical protein
MHHIRTRPLTDDERRFLETRTKSDAVGCFFLAILAVGIPGYGLSLLGSMLGGLHSPQAADWGRWAGVLVWIVMFLPLLVGYRRAEAAQRRRAVRDADEGVVEEIHVSTNRVVEIALVSNNAPILAFDLGGQKILYLQGQWLYDEQRYGGSPSEEDPSEKVFNGLPPPNSFPSREFTITRFPHSGEVAGIRVSGPYLPPAAVVDALKPEYSFADSELFDGDLDDIADVLAREHARRRDDP